jgi:hypothetical protein
MADMSHFLDMADMTSFVGWAEVDSPGHHVQSQRRDVCARQIDKKGVI